MRFLAWHVDYFKCRITERGRSPLVEEYDNPETVAEDALLVLASVEKADEAAPETVAGRATTEIAAHAASLKVRTIVLHPFAHLFGQLSRPAVAVRMLQMVEEGLRTRGLAVTRTPFGWFNTLDIRAKGHPLSRVARIVNAKELKQ
jgi:threonyl-tRNA synthetase